MPSTEVKGVPAFDADEFSRKKTAYCLLIPVINESGRIQPQLQRAQQYGIDRLIDIVICDGGSTDSGTAAVSLQRLGVNTLVTLKTHGRLGSQLRMGFWWALQRGYRGIITIDGNNKDSIESVPLFIDKLEQGFDFIQGSRYLPGGKAVNTPLLRHLAVKYVHAPLISYAAGYRFSDTTNAFRGYSRKYLTHTIVKPFRDVFYGYELLAYLSVRASQLGLKVCEIPVTRAYPKAGQTPTKINTLKANLSLFQILMKTVRGDYQCSEDPEQTSDI
jgi:dolichol-phosphate mannosyltransferase